MRRDRPPVAIDEAHQTLREILAGLDEWVGERAPDADLETGLSTLRDHLERHFAVEESAPLYTTLGIESPRLAPRLTELLAEHPVMLERLDRVLGRLAAQRVDGPVVRRELESLLELIRAHEHAEEEILQQGLHDDIGAAD